VTGAVRAVAGLGALAALVAGCGGGSPSAVRTVEHTRVEVVADAASRTGGFDPHAIYVRDAPGVVTVLAVARGSSDPFGGGSQSAEGSGFVLNGRGEVATNAHVVTTGTGASIRKVDDVYVRFQDGNQVSAKVVGFDANEDVALLRIDPAGLTLRPLALGSSANLAVGAPVAAIGSPFGEPQSLTVGIISAVDRTIDSLNGRFSITGAIQTDAAINHGNSGGPLVDARGRVLGINSQIQSTSGDGSGVGFAIPIDAVKRSLDRLRADGHVDYPYLGVSTTPLYPQLAARLGLPVRRGVLVVEVAGDGPAKAAGLRAGTGTLRFQSQEVPRHADVITRLAGRPIGSSDQLSTALSRFRPGQTVALRVIRDGAARTIRVRLAKRPAQSSR
jgi:S1-C subfamily serine protease